MDVLDHHGEAVLLGCNRQDSAHRVEQSLLLPAAAREAIFGQVRWVRRLRQQARDLSLDRTWQLFHQRSPHLTVVDVSERTQHVQYRHQRQARCKGKTLTGQHHRPAALKFLGCLSDETRLTDAGLAEDHHRSASGQQSLPENGQLLSPAGERRGLRHSTMGAVAYLRRQSGGGCRCVPVPAVRLDALRLISSLSPASSMRRPTGKQSGPEL
jgi:hypothetical protein